MNFIYELLCMGVSPPVSADELRRANFNQFMAKTLSSAKDVTGDAYLCQEAIIRAKTLLGQKSHSSQNTMRTIKTMFAAAKRACEFSRERCKLEWLEVCVTLAVQYGIHGETSGAAVPDTYDRIGVSDSDDGGQVKLPTMPILSAPGAKQKTKKPTTAAPKTRRVQAPRRRKQRQKDTDGEYHPPNEDVKVPILGGKQQRKQAVPVNGNSNGSAAAAAAKKKVNKKNTNHPKQQTGVVTETPIKPGAGTKAVVKYFANKRNGVLKEGYFCRSYFFPSKESYSMFLAVLGSAKTTVEVCVYSLTDDDTSDCLIAAKKRGVRIRIITDDQQAASKYADAERLQRDHGIPYKDDNSASYMHNKFAVIDSKILINGSFNWSRNARFKNRENIMITNIPESIKQFQDEFEKLWELF